MKIYIGIDTIKEIKIYLHKNIVHVCVLIEAILILGGDDILAEICCLRWNVELVSRDQ